MLQTNDLRIGNYFIGYDDKPFQWGLNDFHSLFTGIEVDEIIRKPIELNSEILIKCGFKKYSHEPGYSIGSDDKSERCDEYTIGKLSIMDWGNGFVMSNSFSFDLRVELKYLHQLQNLYYVLTGNEINVEGISVSRPKA